MKITKNFLRISIILLIVSSLISFFLNEYLNTYELDELLFKGYYTYIIDDFTFFVITSISLISCYLSLILIYFFKSIGRTLYLITFIFMSLFVLLMNDFVDLSIISPIDDFCSFLEIFILYLIYFTPLKSEFK